MERSIRRNKAARRILLAVAHDHTPRNVKEKTKKMSDRLDVASTGALNEPFSQSQLRPGVFVNTHLSCLRTPFAFLGMGCSSTLMSNGRINKSRES